MSTSTTRTVPAEDRRDAVVDAYLEDVDRSLIRKNLKLSVESASRS
jgi:hypothetical protein